MPFHVKKNPISRAFFGYKRQPKSDGAPITNAKSPTSKSDARKYDILPSRRIEDKLLQSEVESDNQGMDYTPPQQLNFDDNGRQPALEFEPETQVLDEDNRLTNFNHRQTNERENMPLHSDFVGSKPLFGGIASERRISSSFPKSNPSTGTGVHDSSNPKHGGTIMKTGSFKTSAAVHPTTDSEFDELIARRKSSTKQKLVDTKKIIAHVDPLSPPAEMSPLKPRNLTSPSGAKAILPMPDKSWASATTTPLSEAEPSASGTMDTFVQTRKVPVNNEQLPKIQNPATAQFSGKNTTTSSDPNPRLEAKRISPTTRNDLDSLDNSAKNGSAMRDHLKLDSYYPLDKRASRASLRERHAPSPLRIRTESPPRSSLRGELTSSSLELRAPSPRRTGSPGKHPFLAGSRASLADMCAPNSKTTESVARYSLSKGESTGSCMEFRAPSPKRTESPARHSLPVGPRVSLTDVGAASPTRTEVPARYSIQGGSRPFFTERHSPSQIRSESPAIAIVQGESRAFFMERHLPSPTKTESPARGTPRDECRTSLVERRPPSPKRTDSPARHLPLDSSRAFLREKDAKDAPSPKKTASPEREYLHDSRVFMQTQPASPLQPERPARLSMQCRSIQNSPVAAYNNAPTIEASRRANLNKALEILRRDHGPNALGGTVGDPDFIPQPRHQSQVDLSSRNCSSINNTTHYQLSQQLHTGGFPTPGAESRIAAATLEFDLIADRRCSNRFLEEERVEKILGVQKEPTEKSRGLKPSWPQSIAPDNVDHAADTSNPRRTRCLSEDFGTTVKSGHGLHLFSSDTHVVTTASVVPCTYQIDFQLDDLIDVKDPIMAMLEYRMCERASVPEQRRFLNIDDPNRCTFWVSDLDGSNEHLELDVESAQSQLIEDSLLAGEIMMCELGGAFESSMEIETDGSYGNGFSRKCTTPNSKKPSRRKKLKASLSFRSTSTKSRMRRSFSFNSAK